MHFRKREFKVTGLVATLLIIFILLFSFTAILSATGTAAGVGVSSSVSTQPPSSGEDDFPPSSPDTSLPEITDIFADGYDIRSVETYRPASVPMGYGAVSEETRHVTADILSADSVTSLTDKTLTALNIDIDLLLSEHPVTPVSSPTVIIYHTHTSEGYEKAESQYYPLGKSGVAQSEELSVLAVGNALKQRLESYGINVIHITDSFDSPSRSGSFKRSAAAVEKAAAKAENLALVIDLHRGITQRTGGDRVKPTVYCNGKKAAQISLIACCDRDGSLGCADWEEKLALSLSLNRELCSFSPLLTLPVSLEAQKYNLHLPYPCVMAEIGTDVNTAEEAKLSALLFADAVASLICVS